MMNVQIKTHHYHLILVEGQVAHDKIWPFSLIRKASTDLLQPSQLQQQQLLYYFNSMEQVYSLDFDLKRSFNLDILYSV